MFIALRTGSNELPDTRKSIAALRRKTHENKSNPTLVMSPYGASELRVPCHRTGQLKLLTGAHTHMRILANILKP